MLLLSTMFVIANHEKSYEDPIAVKKGDTLTLSGKTDIWDGHRWLWAIAADGREGWIPDDLVDEAASPHKANRDYTAEELSCVRGEDLQIIEQGHGWALCRNDKGGQGWVPLRNLAEARPE